MPPSLSGFLSCEQWKAALVSWRGRWSVGSRGRWEGWRSQAALRSGTSLVSIQPLRDQQGKVPRENSLQCHMSALWSGKGWCLDTERTRVDPSGILGHWQHYALLVGREQAPNCLILGKLRD